MISIDLLLLVAGQVFTLFLLMAVGFFFTKRGHFTRDTLSRMSHLLMYVVTPCIIIRSLSGTACTPEVTRSVLLSLAALALTYLLYALIVIPLYPKAGPDTRDTLRMATIYSNTGFMGLPLVQGVLGDGALVFCTVALAMFNFVAWTHGILLMGGRGQVSPRRAVLNPGVIGCIIGFILFFTGLELPSPLASAISHMGNMNTPLAMLVIGGQMASANLAETFRQPRLYAVSALKLIIIPLFTALVILPFGLGSLGFSALVILSACPTAGITGIYAQNFRRDTATAAQLITLSTLLSILTLPLIAVAAQAIFQRLGP